MCLTEPVVDEVLGPVEASSATNSTASMAVRPASVAAAVITGTVPSRGAATCLISTYQSGHRKPCASVTSSIRSRAALRLLFA